MGKVWLVCHGVCLLLLSNVHLPLLCASHSTDTGPCSKGFATLNVSGLAPGTEITLKYGEVLKKDGSVDMAWCGDPCNAGPGVGNSANQTDKYIAKGGPEPEVFTPHFTCESSSLAAQVVCQCMHLRPDRRGLLPPKTMDTGTYR